MFLSSSHDHAGEIRTALQGMRSRVDGLILMVPAVPPEVVEALLPRSVPVVLLSSPAVTHENYQSLRVDNAGGARAAVAHLVGHGHRRIGMLLGPAGNHDAEERRR
jgi:LacI family transcriptional regulator